LIALIDIDGLLTSYFSANLLSCGFEELGVLELKERESLLSPFSFSTITFNMLSKALSS
jgi:hypothetical protein